MKIILSQTNVVFKTAEWTRSEEVSGSGAFDFGTNFSNGQIIHVRIHIDDARDLDGVTKRMYIGIGTGIIAGGGVQVTAFLTANEGIEIHSGSVIELEATITGLSNDTTHVNAGLLNGRGTASIWAEYYVEE